MGFDSGRDPRNKISAIQLPESAVWVNLLYGTTRKSRIRTIPIKSDQVACWCNPPPLPPISWRSTPTSAMYVNPFGQYQADRSVILQTYTYDLPLSVSEEYAIVVKYWSNWSNDLLHVSVCVLMVSPQ